MIDILILPHAGRAIPADEVLSLYRAQDWWPERTREQVSAVLSGSPAVGAWHGDRLVGFARAVTDGVLRAYIEDVLVAPRWRGAGVGRALVAGILDRLPVPVVSLFCEPDLAGYYETTGFQRTEQVVLHRS